MGPVNDKPTKGQKDHRRIKGQDLAQSLFDSKSTKLETRKP